MTAHMVVAHKPPINKVHGWDSELAGEKMEAALVYDIWPAVVAQNGIGGPFKITVGDSSGMTLGNQGIHCIKKDSGTSSLLSRLSISLPGIASKNSAVPATLLYKAGTPSIPLNFR